MNIGCFQPRIVDYSLGFRTWQQGWHHYIKHRSYRFVVHIGVCMHMCIIYKCVCVCVCVCDMRATLVDKEATTVPAGDVATYHFYANFHGVDPILEP